MILPRKVSRSIVFALSALTLSASLFAAAPSPAETDDEKGEVEGHTSSVEDRDEEEAEGEGRTFSVEDFEKAGVGLAVAGPGEIDVVTTLPGEVRPNLDRVAHIAARFPGIVGDVRKNLGDQVRAGEVLATIESEQLSTYELRAAFDGTIIEKDVAPGEVITQDRAAFVLANLSAVWVTIRVFQEALPFVRVGQRVLVTTVEGGPEAEGKLSYLSPVVEGPARTATARVVLPNPDGAWRPGLFVTAHLLDPVGVSVAIERRAIQTFDGKPTVFVVDGERFAPREVSLGRAGRTRVEVLSGLSPGERYADTRSFLVKAELGKGEAEEEE